LTHERIARSIVAEAERGPPHGGSVREMLRKETLVPHPEICLCDRRKVSTPVLYSRRSEAATSRKDDRGSDVVRSGAKDGADSVRHRAHGYEPKTDLHGNGNPKTHPYASLSIIARA